VLTIDGPLKRAAVARDAEYHLDLDHLDAALMQCENLKKFGVCRGAEDNLQDTNELQVAESCSGGWTRTNP
jgi:hypothetical protein